MSWHTYGDFAFYACAMVSVLFSLLYFTFAPWRSTSAGRNIMAVMGSLAVALAYFGWVIASGGVPDGFYPMRALLFTSITAAIGWRLVIFIRHHVIRSLREPVHNEEDNDELEDAR
jgi:hypothetical protein